MQLLLFVIAVCFLSCKESPPKGEAINAFVDTADLNARKTIATLKLVEVQPLPPNCGILAFALAQKFEVIRGSNSLAANQIVVIIPCPELYGEGFFKDGSYYQAELTNQNSAPFEYGVVSNYRNSNLKTYWAEKLERSN
jgi:hypothetical protein